MLSLIERRSEIVRQTESKGKVGVEELARLLNVSQVTIRNDLNALNSKGLVVRARGGAVASNRLTRELSMKERHKDNLSVKRRLGRAVAELIGNDVHTIAPGLRHDDRGGGPLPAGPPGPDSRYQRPERSFGAGPGRAY